MKLLVGDWKLDENGIRQIPDAPGLGLTLDRNALVSYPDGELRL